MIGAVLMPLEGFRATSPTTGTAGVIALGVEPRGCRSPAEGWAWCYRLAAHLVENAIVHPRDMRVESITPAAPHVPGFHGAGGPRVRIVVHGDLLARDLKAAVNGAIVRVSEGRR